MAPTQQLLLGAGANPKKTYVDDVFSTFLYKGNATNNHHIQNSVDLTEGGLVWMKDRGSSENHLLVDSEYSFNNSNKYLICNINGGGYSGPVINSFETNGFKLHSNWYANNNNNNYASWSFRKAPGFFDVVTWTGNNGTHRQISHDLGCVPGLILIKCTSTAKDWIVGHREMSATGADSWDEYLQLNENYGPTNDGDIFHDTKPTSTAFTLNNSDKVNLANEDFVAYVFAGGASESATAKSVRFDGSGDALSIPNSSDLEIRNTSATVECWVRFHSHNNHDGIIHNVTNSNWNGGSWILEPVGGYLYFYYLNTNGNHGEIHSEIPIPLGVWVHVAFTKSGNDIKLFQSGQCVASGTLSGPLETVTNPYTIGGQCVGEDCDADISNVRMTVGQVLYTSDFVPSKEPLTTTSQGASASNVKVLCCNNSSVTGSTVTTGTITASSGNPTANDSSPFDDLGGYVFGENSDQNLIKAGSYIGNGNASGTEVYLGWEPTYLIIKSKASGESWRLLDTTRGLAVDKASPTLYPNSSSSEGSSAILDINPTGFKLASTDGATNGSGVTYCYLAIRTAAGTVAKPAAAGTDVFAMDTGGGAVLPSFDSGFPVDWALKKQYAGSGNWLWGSRITGNHYSYPSATHWGGTDSDHRWDSMTGWESDENSGTLSWMWKRTQGFDTVCWRGRDQTGYSVPHSLGKAPEMIILVSHSNTIYRQAGHIGLNGGTNPWNYRLQLNASNATSSSGDYWRSKFISSGGQAPDANYFYLGNAWEGGSINYNNDKMLAMLFASVDGISKCGYYTGNDTSITITTGFQPRFLLIKNISFAYDWVLVDSFRGLNGSGNDPRLYLNEDTAQSAGADYITALDSTSFTASRPFGSNLFNADGHKFIYYAHA